MANTDQRSPRLKPRYPVTPAPPGAPVPRTSPEVASVEMPLRPDRPDNASTEYAIPIPAESSFPPPRNPGPFPPPPSPPRRPPTSPFPFPIPRRPGPFPPPPAPPRRPPQAPIAPEEAADLLYQVIFGGSSAYDEN